MVPVLVAVAVWALVLEQLMVLTALMLVVMVLPMLHPQPSQMKPRPWHCCRSCCVPSDDAAALPPLLSSPTARWIEVP